MNPHASTRLRPRTAVPQRSPPDATPAANLATQLVSFTTRTTTCPLATALRERARERERGASSKKSCESQKARLLPQIKPFFGGSARGKSRPISPAQRLFPIALVGGSTPYALGTRPERWVEANAPMNAPRTPMERAVEERKPRREGGRHHWVIKGRQNRLATVAEELSARSRSPALRRPPRTPDRRRSRRAVSAAELDSPEVPTVGSRIRAARIPQASRLVLRLGSMADVRTRPGDRRF
jgi:hypothetical protein